MFDWLKKKVLFFGGVFFRGTHPPRAKEFVYLKKSGMEVRKLREKPGFHWILQLDHPQWGKCVIGSPKKSKLPEREAIEYAPNFTDSEKKTALAAGQEILVKAESKSGHITRDRKTGLRFLRELMGNDGLFAIDRISNSFWSRGALVEELSHDADLDISQITILHAISDSTDGKVTWLHSHGLTEIGFFDFDILNPGDDALCSASDAVRALSFAIVEKRVSMSTPSYYLCDPGGLIRFVPITDFVQYADRRYVELRDELDLDEHDAKRCVICQPRSGLFSRWSRRIRPSEFFSGEISEDTIIHFSTESSNLMRARALKTYGTLQKYASEFENLGFPVLVKIGYRVDNGGPDDLEHLWFSVHSLGESEIEATLESNPIDVSGLRLGQRGYHPVSFLSDWIIFTPLGSINPRNSLVTRILREKPDVFSKYRTSS
jgi:hypothetical protein